MGSMATFVKNTGQEDPMLSGNITAIVVGAFLALSVSLCTRPKMSKEEVEAEWEKTRDIDNPLSPWVQVYKGELNLEDGENFHDRPPLEIVIRKFRAAKLTAYAAAVAFTLLFVCIWPGSMLSTDILDRTGFTVWTTLSKGWAYVAAAFIIIVPFYQEVRAIMRQVSKNKQESLLTDSDDSSTLTQPLANGAVNTGFANSISSSPRNKHEYIFQRMRHVVGRVLENLRAP